MRTRFQAVWRGVGAGRPLLGRPCPPPRTVRAACHRTRLSMYLCFEVLFVRECSSMQQVVTSEAEDERFPLSGNHHFLPHCFPFGNVLEFSDMVDLKWTLRCFAIFADPRI